MRSCTSFFEVETDEERSRLYRDYLSEPISAEEQEAIVRPVQRGQLTGGADFIDAIAERLGRRIELRGQGRPKKRSENSKTCYLETENLNKEDRTNHGKGRLRGSEKP